MRFVTTLERLPTRKPIFIYGAGGAGRALRQALAECRDRDVAGFLDSNRTGWIDTLPILSIADYLATRPKGAVLVIASQFWDQISSALAAAGIDADYNVSPLIPWLISRTERTAVPSAAGLLDGKKADRMRAETRFRKTLPAIDILLNPNCSHHCAYCCSQTHLREQRFNIVDQIGRETYLERLLRLANGQRVGYRFAGAGECAEQAEFPYLLQGVLRAGHAAVIQTHGFTSKRIAAALALLGPPPYEALSLVVSFHYGAYIDQGQTNRIRLFLNDHFPRLLGLTSRISVVLPITPSIVSSAAAMKTYETCVEDLRAMAGQSGTELTFGALELHGPYQGRHYPESFTEAERRRLLDLLTRYGAGEQRRAMASGDSEAADIMPSIGDFLHLKGMPCVAATRALKVGDDGVVLRCGAGSPALPEMMGLLTEDEVPKIDGDHLKPCPFDRCNCLGMGLELCLDPLGLTPRDYLDEMARISS